MGERTIYEHLEGQGYTRREFMKLCGALVGFMGYHRAPLSGAARLLPGDAARDGLAAIVARALQTAPRAPVIWLQLQDCAGCTSALTRSQDPTMVDLVLDHLTLEYHETLAAAAGFQIEMNKQAAMARYDGQYILVVEGSLPAADSGYCTVGGRSARDLLLEAADGAAAIIATGNCAAFGGIPMARPNPTDARAVSDVLPGRTVVNVPGCPAIPEVTAGVITHFIALGGPPELDDLGRPLPYYGATVHERCERRPFFREGKFAGSFDDEGARQGWCLFELGCKGPDTANACPTMLWGGLSFPVASGHPCLGCSEPGFWDNGGFYPFEPRPYGAFIPHASKGAR